MKYKGRYVAVIEYDFVIDTSTPHVRPIDQIWGMFRDGTVDQELKELLSDEAFDPDMGCCNVTQTLFDMYELHEPEYSCGCATCANDGMDMPQCRECIEHQERPWYRPKDGGAK